MNEKELKLTEDQETLQDWRDGYNCGIQQAESYKSRVHLFLVIAFALGILIGVSI